jgi:colanic acid biosynthesis glycosyl transferase WcaI
MNRYFYPDLSATSQILTDLAVHLAARGLEVVVLTGRQRYTDAKAALPARQDVHGVQVHRLATTTFGRMHLLGRATDYLTFYVSAFVRLVKILRKDDIVVAKTDPPLLSVVAACATRLRGARQVNWLQDLFPEAAVVLHPKLLKRRVVRAIQSARDWSLRHAEANVVLGELMRDRVCAFGIPDERIATIANWADDGSISPVEHHNNPLRAEWGLEGKFVVAYSGNLGRAHEFGTMTEAARLLQQHRDIVFLIIGDGHHLPQVQRVCAEHILTNVVRAPFQPRERLRWSLAVADLHIVSLNPELEGLMVPSKFYGIAAARRPTAFVGDPSGEIGTLLTRYDCGRCFAVDDAQSLAKFVLELYTFPELGLRLGNNARIALDAKWSQATAFECWEALLHRLLTRNDKVGVV